MRKINARLVGGFILILIGGVLLLQNIGFMELGDLIWGLLFLLAGIFCFSIFLNNHINWWVLIPGYVFLGISCIMTLDLFLPKVENVLGGSIFLAAIGLAFIHIFIVDKQNWWAVIPAGVLLTLSLVTGLDGMFKDIETGGLLLMGIGITFAVLPLLPIPEKSSMKWAWIPASILILIGLMIIGISEGLLQVIGSVLLIVLGSFLIIRTLMKRT